MKNSPMASVLLGILGVSAFLSLLLCWFYASNTVEFRNMQRMLSGLQNDRARTMGLVNESIEYSKRNPKIDPVLESIGFRRTGTNAAAKPSK